MVILMQFLVRTAFLAITPIIPISAQAQAVEPYETETGQMAVEMVTGNLEHPWGVEFLPDGRAMVTERPGRVRLIDVTGKVSDPLPGLPEVDAEGQGGLLDVALDPAFEANRMIYFSFAEARDGGNGTSVAKARLSTDATKFENAEVIFRQDPAYASSAHFGSRLVFDPDGKLFVTMGDRFALRDEAQNPANHIGKIVRINTDGSIPADNPKTEGWRPELWSIGHRNVQGATLNPETGKLWTAEHGARGGDEVNAPEAGKNYGWPIITYGVDYSGAKIGEGTVKQGMEQPVHYWDPSIAPGGMTFYSGKQIPQWKGNLLVGALKGQHVARLTFNGDKITGEEKLFQGLGRIRDVKEGPDGLLYLLTDEEDGALLRVKPLTTATTE
jgi:aldose sugar dehydrogenase